MGGAMSKIKKIIEIATDDYNYKEMESVVNRSLKTKADLLKREINIYIAGIEGKIPKEWGKYEKEYERIADPEYKDFLRMKKKFEE